LKFAAKEKLEIVNFRGRAAHFCPPALSEPRKARRGNSVRAILRIHRKKSKSYFEAESGSASAQSFK